MELQTGTISDVKNGTLKPFSSFLDFPFKIITITFYHTGILMMKNSVFNMLKTGSRKSLPVMILLKNCLKYYL